MSQRRSGPGGGLPRESWLWVLGMAAFTILLVVMVDEITDRDRHAALVVGQLAGVAVFAGLLVWMALSWPVGEPARAYWPFGVMGLIAVLVALLTPGEGLLVGTVAALAGLFLARRVAVAAIVGASTVALVSTLIDDRSSPAVSHFLETAAIGFFGYGWARLAETNRELRTAREEVARLAVADERVRFARDLHDLLGHTLSVIRVKSELAARLSPTDPERAAAEMGEVEQISREALVEVRDAVAGFQPDLAMELKRAASALTAAGVAATFETGEVSVNGSAGEALAWVVREAATNVVRHAHAVRCRIGVRRDGDSVTLEVDDDGVGIDEPHETGRGLQGMRERLADVGGSLEVQASPEAGFTIRATVPLDRP